MNLNSIESNIIPKFNYRDLIIFIIPVLIFILYFNVYDPGVLTAASYGQLHQIAANRFTTASPIFYTFFVMLSIKFTGGIQFIEIFQILIFSLMWMIICKYHRDDSSQSSNEFVLQSILTLIICLIPINAVYSITLSSNVLFSYSIMFLCFLIKVMIDKGWQLDFKFTILLALTLAFISGFNNYGILIAFVSLIVIVYCMFRENIPQQELVTLVGATLICMLLIGSLSMLYDVKGNDYDDYTKAMNIPTNDAFDDGINLESARNEFFSSTNVDAIEAYENSESSNAGNFKYDFVDSYVNMFRNNILGGLFDNPILYLALSIILLALITLVSPSEKLYLLYVPPFLNVIVNFVTGQNNLYSNLLVFYLIAVIFISLWFKLNLRPQNILNVITSIAQQKEIETPKSLKPQQEYINTEPTVKQEQEYNDDNYYSDLEYELENLTLDDINEMLGQTSTEETPESDKSYEGTDDLIDEILKEIEIEKK